MEIDFILQSKLRKHVPSKIPCQVIACGDEVGVFFRDSNDKDHNIMVPKKDFPTQDLVAQILLLY